MEESKLNADWYVCSDMCLMIAFKWGVDWYFQEYTDHNDHNTCSMLVFTGKAIWYFQDRWLAPRYTSHMMYLNARLTKY